MTKHAFHGAEVFDGDRLHADCAVLIDGAMFVDIVAGDAIPPEYSQIRLPGGTILPGFVDLQVNGGGGVMFNSDTNADGIATIAKAHHGLGTRAFLPTLITDTYDRTRAAIAAVEKAIAQGVPGVLGIHLEGPHLSVARKGAHDGNLIRPMDDQDEALLHDAVRRLPNVMVTVAPENVSNDQINRLAQAGAIISIGHSDCDAETAQSAFDAGATCVTHLFNAMSQIQNRAPGLVGAALHCDGIATGLIADGIHVHPVNMAIALGAKRSGDVFLVSDAMATARSDIDRFQLNGREIQRQAGRLTLRDGTLAGADLRLDDAVALLTTKLGIDRATALRMATANPAKQLANAMGFGRFAANQPWHGIWLDHDGRYQPHSADFERGPGSTGPLSNPANQRPKS